MAVFLRAPNSGELGASSLPGSIFTGHITSGCVCVYVASVSCRSKKFYETLNFLMHSCSMHALTLASTLMHLPLSICHDLGKELMWSKVVWSMICWIHWACSTAWSRPYDAKFVDWGFSRCLVIPLIGWAPVSTADTSHIPGAIVNMYGFEMAMC